MADDPQAALEQRIEVGRQSGVPLASLERFRERREDDDDNGIDAIVEPDRELVPGVEVETDLGTWQVYETPGHAPSHVCLHQPERKLMISGDHLLGRTVLFFDHGHTPDPVGEFLGSLDEIEPLEVDLCCRATAHLPRPRGEDRRGARQAAELLGRVRASLAAGEKTAFEVVGDLSAARRLKGNAGSGRCRSSSPRSTTGVLGEAEPVEGTDPRRWRAV